MAKRGGGPSMRRDVTNVYVSIRKATQDLEEVIGFYSPELTKQQAKHLDRAVVLIKAGCKVLKDVGRCKKAY